MMNDGKQITLVFGTAAEPCESPFGLSQWGDQPTDRASLDLRTTPEIEQCVRKIDETILAYVQANAGKYFGPSATKEKFSEWFRPTAKEHEEGKYAPLLKTMLSKSRVEVWTPAREAGSMDDIRAHRQTCVGLLVRSLYFQSKGWGVMLECQHVRLADSSPECPFEDEW